MYHILLGPADLDDRIPDRSKCVYWQDDLTIGPVPETETLEDLSSIRISFERELGHAPQFAKQNHSRYTDGATASGIPERLLLTGRDEQLRELGHSAAVVVWCGPNRREMLMLSAVLRFITSSVEVAPCPHWGAMTYAADQLAQSFAARAPLESNLISLLWEIWAGYTASDPAHLYKLYANPPIQIEAVARTLEWILEEYPSSINGLSATEESVLRKCGEPAPISKVVARTLGESDDTLSEVLLHGQLWRFLSHSTPVLEPAEKSVSLTGIGSLEVFRQLPVCLTSLGKRILRGEADYVRTSGVDRWIGGVHLYGHEVPWRFDRQTRRLVGAQR